MRYSEAYCCGTYFDLKEQEVSCCPRCNQEYTFVNVKLRLGNNLVELSLAATLTPDGTIKSSVLLVKDDPSINCMRHTCLCGKKN